MAALPRDDELVARWTAEQHRQRAAAIFADHELSFSLSGAGSAVPRARYVGSPTVYREDLNSVCFDGLHTVGGLDISFRNAQGEEGIAVLAVLSFPDLKVLTSISHPISLGPTPYVPSFLSFREADHYASLLEELRTRDGPVPQVLFVDGNGRWHPRQAGSAVAVGVKTGLPTVGVAKEYHPLLPASDSAVALGSSTSADPALLHALDFRLTQRGMRKACHALLEQRGDWLGLPPPSVSSQAGNGEAKETDEYWGSAVLASPAKGASNPVFVSPGHRLSLSTSLRLALISATNGKVPEPVRQADLIGREEVRKRWG
ncbi:hypothetical protein JCM1841_000537 [Sporobolomyces salmonicolor]